MFLLPEHLIDHSVVVTLPSVPITTWLSRIFTVALTFSLSHQESLCTTFRIRYSPIAHFKSASCHETQSFLAVKMGTSLFGIGISTTHAN
jgi:hypothetical protein